MQLYNKYKKIILSFLIIAVVGGGAIGATYAYFTAQRTTSANTFTAGTLDLDVSSNGTKLEPFVIDNVGENGDITGTKTWVVKNTGSLPGRLLVRLSNVANKENGCNDPEKEAEATCEDDTAGEMGNVIIAKVAFDGTDKVSSTLATNQANKIGTDWNALSPLVLQPGESKNVTIHWATSETDYGNEIQSDSVQFDVNFRLIQQISGPTPTN
ncbi:MAG: SipW-dependent-type signal peptide-containing protein [Candidatus Levybacteria bacterium]|nr:SipW-dependent-type signal peptide-containing protein [Candidatus Levybacteria bacterium]